MDLLSHHWVVWGIVGNVPGAVSLIDLAVLRDPTILICVTSLSLRTALTYKAVALVVNCTTEHVNLSLFY